MSLEKIYSSRPFKAMAAFLFGLMVLSACQETVQQVVTKATPSENQSTVVAGKSEMFDKLTEQEQTFIKQLADDADTQFLANANRNMIVKMKLAINKDRAGLKQALESKDSKAMLKALNFSQEEFVEISKQRILASQRWQAKFGDKKEMLANLRSKYGQGSSTECISCNQNDGVKNIDATLDKMHSVNLPPTVSELQKNGGFKTKCQFTGVLLVLGMECAGFGGSCLYSWRYTLRRG